MTTDTGPPTNQALKGNADPSSASSDFNVWSFMIQGALAKIRTIEVVKVISCTKAGELSPAGTVDVQPMVNQLDGYGKPIPHVTIYKRPYLRLQGGIRGIILDPVAGDLGLLACCDRDTSTVLNTLAQANPGSARKFDFADGFFIPAIGTGTLSDFIQFIGGDINITATGKVVVTAPEVDVISDNVNLGGAGGVKVALVGDNVSGGVIVGPGATKVRAI